MNPVTPLCYERFRAQPTILNNFLWYGIAETKTDYKLAFYSILDSKNTTDTFITIPKDNSILDFSDKSIAFNGPRGKYTF